MENVRGLLSLSLDSLAVASLHPHSLSELSNANLSGPLPSLPDNIEYLYVLALLTWRRERDSLFINTDLLQ